MLRNSIPRLDSPVGACNRTLTGKDCVLVRALERISSKGIKPRSKKVQAILTLNPPNNVKELRLLRNVQY
jgi:hypothetical protein